MSLRNAMAQRLAGRGQALARNALILAALGLTIMLGTSAPSTLLAQTGRSPFEDLPGTSGSSDKRDGFASASQSREANVPHGSSPIESPSQRVVQKSREFALHGDKQAVSWSGTRI